MDIQRFRISFFLLVSLLLGLWLMNASPALASIHEYPEGGERVMVRSLQAIRDRTDQAWQLVLFKRKNEGQIESVHLRLVAFPGEIAVSHPKPLRILNRDRGWLAADALPNNSPFPANVGEYDVIEPIGQLSSNVPLQLFLPTQTGDVELIVPSFVVKEWRHVMNE